jgi:hypothetical protein
MHGILSLAALHVAYLNPSDRRRNMLIAAQHHDLSLQGFREEINQINENNSAALFLNSTFIFMYAYVVTGSLFDTNDVNVNATTRTSQVLGADWIPLVRGVKTVLNPGYSSVRTGPLRSILEMGNWDELPLDEHSGPEDRQIVRLQEIWRDQEHSELYDETLHLLRKINAWIMQCNSPLEAVRARSGNNQDYSAPFIWTAIAPEQFFKLLQQRQPHALCIFAYFGAVVQSLDKYWWMEGCAKSIVSVIDECLGPYWSHHLEWPKRVVGLS